MKNLLTRMLAVACLSMAVIGLAAADTVSVKPPAGDQHHRKIVLFNVDAQGWTLGFVLDGHKGAGTLNEVGINNILPRVSINTVTVKDLSGAGLYQGLDATWRFYDRNGLAGVFEAGWKGLQLDGSIGTNYPHPWFVGLGFTKKF